MSLEYPYLKRILFVLPLLAAGAPAPAEITASRFICALGNDGRVIELVYLERENSVPCEIREARYDGNTRTLWRASYDAGFCRRQLADYRNKLESLGWPCETTAVDQADFASINPPPGPQPGFALPSATAQSYRDSGPASEVILYEYEFANDNADSGFPTPPDSLPDSLTDDVSSDETEHLSRWLMYLSARSLASIEKLMPDAESFANYQTSEAIQARNIYHRLHKRIEFLHSMLDGE